MNLFRCLRGRLGRTSAYSASLVAALLLTACGGGHDGADPAPPPVAMDGVPASAIASASAYTGYAASLPASEQQEPVSLASVGTPPGSETDEPLPVAR